jgi:hypothetical protein
MADQTEKSAPMTERLYVRPAQYRQRISLDCNWSTRQSPTLRFMPRYHSSEGNDVDFGTAYPRIRWAAARD